MIRQKLHIVFSLLFFIGIVLASRAPAVTSQADIYVRRTLEQGDKFYSTGNFLLAAKAFRLVIENQSKSEISIDPELHAEALYKFAECGFATAKALTARLRFAFSHNTDGLLTETIAKIGRDVKEFQQVGIMIKQDAKGEYYEYPDRRYLVRASSSLPKTIWGEKARFRLITFSESGDSRSIDPGKVRRRAEAFLRDYPKSQVKTDAQFILAKAYITLWNIYQDEELRGYFPNHFSKEELEDPNRLCRQALKLLKKIRSQVKELKSETWDESLDGQIKELKKGRPTDVMYYYWD